MGVLKFARLLTCYWFLKVFFITLCLTSASTSTSENSNGTAPLQRLSRAHLEFALTLFRKMTDAAPEDENVIVSPYSIASVLSQLWLGAEPNSTESESLSSVLNYDAVGLRQDQVHEAFLNSLETFQDSDYKSVVQTANAMFVQMGTKISPEFDADLRKYYNSSVDEVDFRNGEAIARSIINRWVLSQTKGQIPTILDDPLPTDTILLLVNALAFKALWKNSFDPLGTAAEGVFYPSPSEKIEIPMMTGKFQVLMGVSSELNCRLLELPFRGRRLSMFIVLPGTGNTSEEQVDAASLSKIESSLDAENLKKLFSTLTDETVRIRMPRFRISHSSSIGDTLRKMGLGSIFDSVADFSRITPSTDPFHVSTIAHKVVLEVTEKGAQAAAATATGIERLGSFGEKFFEVNRPFIFFIWDYHSGALLFIGRVIHPEPLLL